MSAVVPVFPSVQQHSSIIILEIKPSLINRESGPTCLPKTPHSTSLANSSPSTCIYPNHAQVCEAYKKIAASRSKKKSPSKKEKEVNIIFKIVKTLWCSRSRGRQLKTERPFWSSWKGSERRKHAPLIIISPMFKVISCVIETYICHLTYIWPCRSKPCTAVNSLACHYSCR